MSSSGIYTPTDYGLVGDGSTDDGPALQTLANTTISSTGGTVYFAPGQTYLIATNTTIPSSVTAWLPQNAVFRIDNCTLTIRGPIDAPLAKIFDEANGGKVYFEPSGSGGSSSTPKGRLSEVYPEWWGAAPDGTTDCTRALQACVDSVAAYTSASGGTGLNPATAARYATAMIRLGTGCYVTTAPISILSLRALSEWCIVDSEPVCTRQLWCTVVGLLLRGDRDRTGCQGHLQYRGYTHPERGRDRV